jgi:3,4-dihydroxy 2-butanone 4-phosphate synthase/GTP cyclohydrolase II
MENYIITNIETAIEEIKNGNIIIIVDDEDRENEGDFFIPAQIVKPEHINFMARVGGGLVCVSINYERFYNLELEVPIENTSKFSTPLAILLIIKMLKREHLLMREL